jgi:hypothetical protein
MFLADYFEAINALMEHLGGYSCCFNEIVAGLDRMCFKMSNGEKYVYFYQNRRIEKWYFDTWKNPEHKEVIYEGDEEEI